MQFGSEPGTDMLENADALSTMTLTRTFPCEGHRYTAGGSWGEWNYAEAVFVECRFFFPEVIDIAPDNIGGLAQFAVDGRGVADLPIGGTIKSFYP